MNLVKFNTKIPSDTNYICDTVAHILSFFEEIRGSLDECTLFELKVILNELLVNAIKHGNGCDASKAVTITAAVAKGGYACFQIEDEGGGYECRVPAKASQTIGDITDLCDLKETGRGLLIVSNLCDQIRFNRRGNKVVVLKKI